MWWSVSVTREWIWPWNWVGWAKNAFCPRVAAPGSPSGSALAEYRVKIFKISRIFGTNNLEKKKQCKYKPSPISHQNRSKNKSPGAINKGDTVIFILIICWIFFQGFNAIQIPKKNSLCCII